MTIEHLARDLRYACRGLWRDRAFSITTVATLAVSLALVTVVFAIFNAYVLRPYAVRDPYSLHEIRWRSRDAGGRTFRWRDYEELRGRQDLFDAVIAERNRTVWSDGQRLVAAFVSGNYFDSLGGRIQVGRGLAEFDAQRPGGEPVAVLSHHAWTRLFDRDPAALGRGVRLNDQTFVIVGIMHEEFTGLNDSPPDLWVPVTMHPAVLHQDLFGLSQPRELAVIARLRSGVPAEQAENALDPFMARVVERSGAVRAAVLPQATPAPLSLELLAVLSPVFAAFVLVLIAACANVSNVMLARATARHREIGIRLSIGASRRRVVWQLLTEGFVISALAGGVALALASLLLRTGLTMFFLSLPASAVAETRVVPLDFDYRVFVFTFVVAASTTLMFALLPALQATRATLTQALRGEIIAGLRSSRLRSLLVVSQVAVSLVLLITAATLVRNGTALGAIDLGFETRGVMSVKQHAQGERLISEAAAALMADPRVGEVAVTSRNPLDGQMPKVPLRMRDRAGVVVASYMFVSPEYFSMLRIPILRGRGFHMNEAHSEANVAVISAAAAAALWPGADPLGKTIRIWLAREERRPDLTTRRELAPPGDAARQESEITVIGVTKDVVSGIVYEGRDAAHLYLPTSPTSAHANAILVKGRSLQDLRQDALQGLLQKLHPNPLAFEALSLDEALAFQMYALIVASWIGLLLSAIALALSVSGVYGVVRYTIGQRTKEIGIRMALGASSAMVARHLMTQSARVVVVGASIGLIVSFGVMATLRSVVPLRNVSFLDAGAFATSLALIAAAAGLASYYPTRRAARIDPAHTLRAEG